MRVFISYSSQQRPMISALAQDLEGLFKIIQPDVAVSIWYDQELIGGHDWWASILDEIDACDLFVFGLSAEALDSQACKREVEYAHGLNKRILPVLITDDVDTGFLPETLQRIQWIDYRERGTAAAHQNLLKGLVNLPEPVPPPSPVPPRPDAPISPLAKLGARIDSTSLDLQLQAGLMHEIKQYLDQPKHQRQARQLLQRLAQHPDVRASIAREIDELLEAETQQRPVSRAAPPTQPIIPPPSVTPSAPEKPQRNLKPYLMGVGGGLLVAMVLSAFAPTLDFYDPYWGVYTSTLDFEAVCGNFIVWPLLGLGGGWLYNRSRRS